MRKFVEFIKQRESITEENGNVDLNAVLQQVMDSINRIPDMNTKLQFLHQLMTQHLPAIYKQEYAKVQPQQQQPQAQNADQNTNLQTARVQAAGAQS